MQRYNCTTGGMEQDTNGEYVLYGDVPLINEGDMPAAPLDGWSGAWKLTLEEIASAHRTIKMLLDANEALEARFQPQTAQPASGAVDELPPLPEPKYCADDLADIFTADQMREYARAAAQIAEQQNKGGSNGS